MSVLKNVFEFLPHVYTKSVIPTIYAVQTRHYAARKGYREQKAKTKVKTEVKKSTFEIKKKVNLPPKGFTRKFDDSWKKVPHDNVYPQAFYKWPTYTFEEAIRAHRETHHPQMYNQPNAFLHVIVDLNTAAEKKNKYMDNFTRVAHIPHPFDHGEERTILAFTKSPETIEDLKKAGALKAGGVELIKQVQSGALSLQDYQYVVAHPNILPELSALRGLLKRKFPQPRMGNLDVDLVNVVLKFYHGVNYSCVKDEFEKDFGMIDARIGMLNMDATQLEENFASFINDVYQQKPKRAGSFITRTVLTCPPSGEKLKIDFGNYIESIEDTKAEAIQEEVEDEAEGDNEKERAVAG